MCCEYRSGYEGLVEISEAQAVAEVFSSKQKMSRDGTNAQAPVVKRAIASERYYRELFVCMPLENVLVEGFIDLLFDEKGRVVIADYRPTS